MDLIKKYLPKTYYADRDSEERIKLFVEHWRRLVKVNQELEQKIDSFLLGAKVKPANIEQTKEWFINYLTNKRNAIDYCNGRGLKYRQFRDISDIDPDELWGEIISRLSV